MNYEKRLEECFESIKDKIPLKPEIAVVLGSGLGALADEIEIAGTLDYSEIKGFPVSTVPGHKGRFVFGRIDGAPVVIMQGRVHFYEGYDMNEVVIPTRIMKLMGAKVLFLTNASGGINADFGAGDFMLIEDQISCFVPNPLIGGNIASLGVRFPDMSEIYDRAINKIISASAEKLGIKLQKGVYVQLTGPSFESPAEIRMLGRMGGDAVGMSTAVEAIAARHAGMKVCGISCIANKAAGLSENPLTHKEVMEAADKAAPMFKSLIKASVSEIYKELSR